VRLSQVSLRVDRTPAQGTVSASSRTDGFLAVRDSEVCVRGPVTFSMRLRAPGMLPSPQGRFVLSPTTSPARFSSTNLPRCLGSLSSIFPWLNSQLGVMHRPGQWPHNLLSRSSSSCKPRLQPPPSRPVSTNLLSLSLACSLYRSQSIDFPTL